MDEKLVKLERRVERLEERVRSYYDALQDDPEMVEQTAQILHLIRQHPRASQRGLCDAAKQRFGISRDRALHILRRETGRLWRTEDGAFGSKLYSECERNGCGTDSTQQLGKGGE